MALISHCTFAEIYVKKRVFIKIKKKYFFFSKRIMQKRVVCCFTFFVVKKKGRTFKKKP